MRIRCMTDGSNRFRQSLQTRLLQQQRQYQSGRSCLTLLTQVSVIPCGSVKQDKEEEKVGQWHHHHHYPRCSSQQYQHYHTKVQINTSSNSNNSSNNNTISIIGQDFTPNRNPFQHQRTQLVGVPRKFRCNLARHNNNSELPLFRRRCFSNMLPKNNQSNNNSNNNNNDDTTSNNNEKQQNKQDIVHMRSRRFWTNWIRALQSPPNAITITRILCSPLLSYWIISGQHDMALAGCIIAGASDWFDGYLAKHHNMSTVLGGYLDPMADKVVINVLAASLWYTSILPTPLTVIWFGRDILLIIGTATYARMNSKDSTVAFDPTVTPLKVNPTMIGKCNTALQFLTLGTGIALPLYNVPPELFTGLCYLTGFTTIASGLSYIDMSAFDASGNIQENDDDNDWETSKRPNNKKGSPPPNKNNETKQSLK